MSRGTRLAAVVGIVVAFVCLSAAPALAAPRAEEPPRASPVRLYALADHVADLFGDWVRAVFAPSGCAGDPDGSPCPPATSSPPAGGATLETQGGGAGDPDA